MEKLNELLIYAVHLVFITWIYERESAVLLSVL